MSARSAAHRAMLMRSNRLRLEFLTGSGGDGAAVDVDGGCVDGDALALLVLLISFQQRQAILELIAVCPAAALLQGDGEAAISGDQLLLLGCLHGVEQATTDSFHLLLQLLHCLAELAEGIDVELGLVSHRFGAGGFAGYNPLADVNDAWDGPLVAGGGCHGGGVVCGEVERLTPPCCSSAGWRG